MVFIISLESYDCQNHRISDQNKLRKALCLVARFVSFYYNSDRARRLAVDTFLMLVGMVYAVSSHFVDVFYKFLFHLLFVFF